MNMLFSVLGLLGGILCAAGDILFDLKGKGNQKLGTSGNIDSNWVHMPYWRFGASILVAFLGDALIGFGFYSLVCQMGSINTVLTAVTGLCGYVSVIAGFFVHTVLCLLVGMGLRKLKPDLFYDLPGIILPSLGMGMYGLIGIVNLL